MGFGDRVRTRREELGLTRAELSERLGVSASAVSNYETGVSFPKEEVMLRLFDCLEADPNTAVSGQFPGGGAGADPQRAAAAGKIPGAFPFGPGDGGLRGGCALRLPG